MKKKKKKGFDYKISIETTDRSEFFAHSFEVSVWPTLKFRWCELSSMVAMVERRKEL